MKKFTHFTNIVFIVIVAICLSACTEEYQIGEIGPAGGIVFYDQGKEINGWRYLEVAPPETEIRASWSSEVYEVTGTSRDIGTGKVNTAFINHENQQKGEKNLTAAQYCANLSLGGFADWFLPSHEELNLIYENLHTKGYGGFVPEWYVSSSQESNQYAHDQLFSSGIKGLHFKPNLQRVRAIRAFSKGRPSKKEPVFAQKIEIEEPVPVDVTEELKAIVNTVYQVQNLNPGLGRMLDFSEEGEIEFNRVVQALSANEWNYDRLTSSERAIAEKYDIWETTSGYWQTEGDGCSWYCGEVLFDITASSALPQSNSGITYTPDNIHYFSYATAWVEAAEGHGIGEWITYTFRPTSARVTTFYIANGYVKSEKAYYENSRVKRLRMYVDNKPFAILNLQDVRREQVFEVGPLGRRNLTDDREKLELLPDMPIKFEILEVYPGSRYTDTVITEIKMSGWDAH